MTTSSARERVAASPAVASAAGAPATSGDRAAETAVAAGRLFGVHAVEVDVQLSESTIVARLADGSADVAVKIFDAADVDVDLVEWRHSLAAVAAEAGLPVPAPLHTSAGVHTIRALLGGRDAIVQASHWSPGVPLADWPVDATLLHEVGSVAARLSTALQRAPQPPAHEPHGWDLRSSADTLRDALARVSDAGTRVVGLRAIRVFHSIEHRLAHLPQGIVHHDLHDDNLLVGAREGGRPAIVGILDFGDATSGPLVADIAVPAAYAARHVEDPARAIDQVVAGWSSVQPLTADETSVIVPLAAVRLATNAAVWNSRAHGDRGAYAATRSHGSLRTATALLDHLDDRA